MYPSADHVHLVARLSDSEPPSRTWTLRDDNHQAHHGVVGGLETPVIRLQWRSSASAPVQVVGTFRLHLRTLLRERYVRAEPVGGTGDRLRVRFCRQQEVIYLQVNEDSPALPIGQVR